MKGQSLLKVAVFMWLPLLVFAALADAFTEEMNWGGEDYVAATLFLAAGTLLYALIRQKVAEQSRRVLLFAVAFIVLSLLWGLLAVGF
jgi:hypothetical protein